MIALLRDVLAEFLVVKRKWLTPPAPADKLGTPGSDGAEVMP